jgi:ankyrin repeat protein
MITPFDLTKCDLTKCDYNRAGALHAASAKGTAEDVRALVARGMNMNARDVYARVPLKYACNANNVATALSLIELGADVSAVASDSTGESPLGWACQLPTVHVLEAMIVHGADVNYRDRRGRSALHIACMAGHVAQVQLLIAHGANLTFVDMDGKTALDYACWAENLEICKILITAGHAPANVKHRKGWSAESTALLQHHYAMSNKSASRRTQPMELQKL